MPTESLLRSPEAETAFAFYPQMRLGRRRCRPHPHEVSQIIQDVGFLTGKTAMCINGPWFQPVLAETKLAGNGHVAHVPCGSGDKATRVTWDGIAMPPAWTNTPSPTPTKAAGILACRALAGRAHPPHRRSE